VAVVTPWIATIACALCVGVGFASGYALKARLAEGEIARIEAAHAAERQAAAEAAAQRMAAAEAAEAAVVRALSATKQQLAAANRRLKEDLYALPTAQRCGLSGAARGLLNARLAAGDAVPARAAEPDAAPAAAAADTRDASEADIGGWIADAAAAYDECRARLDAIRRWDELTHGDGNGR